ncbi:MAG: PilZ domain-containing protein [Firmicutes bacterium]|nr:PilZ domain-containing protein [Bacillota bacterium]
MSGSFKDRRKHVRIPMVCVIQIGIEGEGEMQHCMLVDLSAGGARILSQFPIGVGDTLELIIPLSETDSVYTKGNLVWVKEMELMKEYRFGVEYMAGVQFGEPNQQIAEHIKNFTEK